MSYNPKSLNRLTHWNFNTYGGFNQCFLPYDPKKNP